VRVTYVGTPSGLKQTMTIGAPGHPGNPGAVTVIGVELATDGDVIPELDSYFVNLVGASGEKVLRMSPVEAKDADGEKLAARFELVADEAGVATGIRVIVEAIDPAYPIEIDSVVASAAPVRDAAVEDAVATTSGEIVGVPVTLGLGITETVDQMMERERQSPPLLLRIPRATHPELEQDLELKEDPNAPPPLSHWPPIEQSLLGAGAGPVGPPNLPQTVGTSFKGIGLNESGAIPPDSMGDVGPTQILMHTNGRIKVFSKTGTVGALNVTDATFWAPIGSGISDPQVRYDRLSGRWFVLGITLENPNNRIVLAVSSGSTITGTASFTFFQFNIGTPSPSDAVYFCDYPGFGVDKNALYTGCNMFGASFHSSAFVIRKSSVLGAGPIVVTGFFNIGSPGSSGPYAPRGVDNDDPAATQGFIIGSDTQFLNRLSIRKVSNPGGAPSLGANVSLVISNTNNSNQPALGSSTAINSSDTRLFSASIRKNKITGVTSLWTSHSVETDATCTPSGFGNERRLGAKWYEIGNLSGTPSVTRFGTLCTTGPGAGIVLNSERGFVYPTVVETGQGHMALSASYASETEFAGVAAAGRLRTDPASGTRAPETIVLTGGAAYTLLDGTRNRWGDYSHTDVDPTDDQTVWTFQEYADTSANNWAVRAVQLKAPPPPTFVVSPNPVCLGQAAFLATVVGTDSCAAPTCTNGLCTGGGVCPEFFDPGPDTGGPGFSNHLQVSVTGGVTVNSASLVIPANPATERVLNIALSLNTTAATAGLKTISIVNPDMQGKNATFTVVANRVPVSVVGGPYSSCQNGSVTFNGTASSDPDSICGDSISLYEWDLDNDGAFDDATGATPTLTWAQLGALGLGVGPHTIKLRVTDTHTATNSSTGTLTISSEGTSCSDGNACTQTDSCQSAVCVGSNPVVCSASDQCHDVGVCAPATGVCSNPNRADGSGCTDGNACTQTDSCQSGVCTGANPVVCNDNDPCTTDACNTGTGLCGTTAAPDGTACDDVNACTQTDGCQSGVCAGGNPVICTASDTCHLVGSCDTGTGFCSNPTAPDNTPCDDSNPTACGDICTNGICAGHPVAQPPEIDGSLRVDKTPSDATITWTDAPGPYSVYRGSNGPGGTPWAYNQACLAPGLAPTNAVDTDVPSAGTFYYYLVVRLNECRESILGMDSQSNTIPNALPCPPAP